MSGHAEDCQYCLVNSTWFLDYFKEYTDRYGKIVCQTAMNAAKKFEEKTGKRLECHKEATPFALAEV